MNRILILFLFFLVLGYSSSQIWGSRPINRISAQKCKEYIDMDKVTFHFGGLSLGPSILQNIEISKCNVWDGLIVGGIKVNSAKEFPHMVALGWENNDGSQEFACGGALISERFVLTVAHCHKKEGQKPSFVRLGDLDLGSVDDSAKPKDYDIEKFTKHPDYNARKRLNDIALIELKEIVNFTEYIKPACLQQSFHFDKNVIATGWGKTRTYGETSDVLMKVKLTTINNARCFEQIKDEIKNDQIFSTQVCTQDEGRDTCQGDSGGPIQVLKRDKKCTFYVVGLTSYGVSKCGSGVPSVYTRVSSYLTWIESIVWPKQD